MKIRRLFSVIGLGFALASAAFGAVQFKANPTNVTAHALLPYDLDLNTLLTNVGSGNLSWSSNPQIPAWMKLDSPNHRITGTPTKLDLGTKMFRLSVKDGEEGATAQINVTVDVIPVWDVAQLDLGTQPEGAAWSFDVGAHATDPIGGTLTFSATGLPGWMSLSTAGKLSGTPKRADVGPYSGIVITAKTLSGGTAQVPAFGKVQKVVQAPKWVSADINLPDATEDSAYSQDVTSFALNFEQTTLDYTATPPTWLSMTPQGVLSGTPGQTDLVPAQFEATLHTIIDGVDYSDKTTFHIKVIHTNHAPFWTESPIHFVADEERPFTFDLTAYAKDPDVGDKLKYQLISGPAWASVSADGKFSGTAPSASGTTHTLQVRTSDGALSADTTIELKINNVNKGPVVSNPLAISMKERAVRTEDLKTWASDPDGDPVNFTLLNPPAWAALDRSGNLNLAPKHADLGNHVLTVEISDGSLSTVGTITVTVLRDARPPQWKQDPIEFNATLNKPFTATVADKAEDLDGEPLTFAKTVGAAWLKVSADGQLTGTPPLAGDIAFTLTAKNDVLTTPVQLIVHVIDPNRAPVISQPLAIEMKERSTRTEDLKTWASDPDGDAVTFKLINGLNWVTLTAQGALKLSPLHAHLGQHSFSAEVSDGKLKTTGLVTVNVIRDARPPVWIKNPIEFNATLNKPFNADIHDQASDPDGVQLTFAKDAGDGWLSVGSDGKLSGVPPAAGDAAFTVSAKNDALSTPVQVIIHVIDPNRAPVIASTLTLDVKERATRTQNLATWAMDPDGDTLSFKLVSPLPWTTLTSQGMLTLSPLHSHIGSYTLAVEASDGKLTTTGNVKVNVLRDARPPQWAQDPIEFNATLNKPFTATLADKVTELDGVPLTFSKLAGAAWLSLAANGTVSGTPPSAGDSVFTISAKNDLLSSPVQVIIHVIDPNQAPVILQTLVLDVKERAIRTEDLTAWATDPDGDPLTFKLLNPVAWVSLTPQGSLQLSPLHPHLGTHSFNVEVTDGKLSTAAAITVHVLRDARPPQWTENPIRFKTVEGLPFSASVANKAVELDGEPLTFAKQTGPSWLSVSPDGKLTGTAPLAGTDTFTLTATNDAFSTPVEVIITVAEPNHAPYWTENPIRISTNEQAGFSFDLKGYAQDPDGDALVFNQVSGPAWATVTNDGRLTGTAPASQATPFLIQVTATDTVGLSASTTVELKILHVNRPPVIAQSLEISVPERAVKKESLTSWATDADGDALSFTLANPPDWATLSTQGLLTLSPQHKDIGNYTFSVQVSDGAGQASGTILVHVLREAQPPQWKQDPIEFTASIRKPFKASIANLAVELDGLPLSFAKKAGPAWLSVSSGGDLSGTPPAVGDAVFTVTARNDLLETPVQVIIHCIDTNHPPYWTQSPIDLPPGFVAKAYSADISPFAKDDDVGDTLTFSKVSGSSWIQVSSSGQITGTPQLADKGLNIFAVRVTDNNGASADVVASIDVRTVNHPPEWTSDPIAMGEFEIGKPISFDFAAHATDPDSDVLHFKKVDGPLWMQISDAGQASGTGTPIGEFVGTVSVSDGEFTVTASFFGKIVNPSAPPAWSQDPIHFYVTAGDNFSDSIAGYASDPQGLPLTFKKTSGPAWISLTAQGAITAQVPVSATGDIPSGVEVSNGTRTAAATVIFHVKPYIGTDTEDVTDLDSPVAGAKVETLWVVDRNECAESDILARELTDYIDSYSKVLTAGKTAETTAVLSSDPVQAQGNVMRGRNGKLILQNSELKWRKDFTSRVDQIYTEDCHNSAITSMYVHYNHLPSISEIYHNGYIESSVPMEVVVVSKQQDYFKYYGWGNPEKSWSAGDFTHSFQDTFRKEKKGYRIHAIAPAYKALKNPLRLAFSDNAYATMASITGGKYFTVGYSFDMASTLTQVAEEVRRSANVQAKKKIKLSKTPQDPGAIKVFIGTRELKGNSTAGTDEWAYSASDNSVLLFWDRIGFQTVPAGAKLSVRYQAKP